MTRRGRWVGVTMLGSGTRPKSSLTPSTAPKRRGVVSGATEAHPALLALSEAQFQRIVRAHLVKCGFVVWVFPIMKRTMAGVPDLTFWHPDRPGRVFCWELKRERRAVISPKQQVAIDHLATVAGIDARIVKPSDWEKLRDEVLK